MNWNVVFLKIISMTGGANINSSIKVSKLDIMTGQVAEDLLFLFFNY